MTRYFLDHDALTGQNVADMLGLPRANWTRCVAGLLVDAEHFLGTRHIEAVADKAVSYVSRHLLEGLLLVERGGKRAPFWIPDSLKQRWRVAHYG